MIGEECEVEIGKLKAELKRYKRKAVLTRVDQKRIDEHMTELKRLNMRLSRPCHMMIPSTWSPQDVARLVGVIVDDDVEAFQILFREWRSANPNGVDFWYASHCGDRGNVLSACVESDALGILRWIIDFRVNDDMPCEITANLKGMSSESYLLLRCGESKNVVKVNIVSEIIRHEMRHLYESVTEYVAKSWNVRKSLKSILYEAVSHGVFELVASLEAKYEAIARDILCKLRVKNNGVVRPRNVNAIVMMRQRGISITPEMTDVMAGVNDIDMLRECRKQGLVLDEDTLMAAVNGDAVDVFEFLLTEVKCECSTRTTAIALTQCNLPMIRLLTSRNYHAEARRVGVAVIKRGDVDVLQYLAENGYVFDRSMWLGLQLSKEIRLWLLKHEQQRSSE